MISVNHVTLSGKLTDHPRRIVYEKTNTIAVIFKIHNDTYVNTEKRASYTVMVKCFGNVAEFVDANLSAKDEVIVSGLISSYNQVVGKQYLYQLCIKALAVSKLEQEMYK